MIVLISLALTAAAKRCSSVLMAASSLAPASAPSTQKNTADQCTKYNALCLHLHSSLTDAMLSLIVLSLCGTRRPIVCGAHGTQRIMWCQLFLGYIVRGIVRLAVCGAVRFLCI